MVDFHHVPFNAVHGKVVFAFFSRRVNDSTLNSACTISPADVVSRSPYGSHSWHETPWGTLSGLQDKYESSLGLPLPLIAITPMKSVPIWRRVSLMLQLTQIRPVRQAWFNDPHKARDFKARYRGKLESIDRFKEALEFSAKFATMSVPELEKSIADTSSACSKAEARVATFRQAMAERKREHANTMAELQRKCAEENVKSHRALLSHATKELESARHVVEAAGGGAVAGVTTSDKVASAGVPCLDEDAALNTFGSSGTVSGGSGDGSDGVGSGSRVELPSSVGGVTAGSGQDGSAMDHGSGGRHQLPKTKRGPNKSASRPSSPETRVVTRLMKRQQGNEVAGVQTRSKRRRSEEAGSGSSAARGVTPERGTKRRAASTRQTNAVKKVRTATGARAVGTTTELGKRSCAAAAGEAQTEHAAKRARSSTAVGVKSTFGADGGAAEVVEEPGAPPDEEASSGNQETVVSFANG